MRPTIPRWRWIFTTVGFLLASLHNVQFWKVTNCASSPSPLAGCVLFVCFSEGFCSRCLPRGCASFLNIIIQGCTNSSSQSAPLCHPSLSKLVLPQIRVFCPQSETRVKPLGSSEHSSLIQKSVASPTPNAFHYLSIIRLELFTSLPLIIHFTAFVISMEGGTKAGLFSLQSPSHFWLVNCLANVLGSSRPLPVSVLSPRRAHLYSVSGSEWRPRVSGVGVGPREPASLMVASAFLPPPCSPLSYPLTPSLQCLIQQRRTK